MKIAGILKNLELLICFVGKYAKRKHVHAYYKIALTRVKIVKLLTKHFCLACYLGTGN